MRLTISIIALALLSACSASEDVAVVQAEPSTPGPHIVNAINSLDRPESDIGRDAGRHPAEILTFAGIEQGWTVADIGSGGGYYTRILSAAVGSEGEVVSHNFQWVVDRFPSTDEAQQEIISNRDNVSYFVSDAGSVGAGLPSDLDAAIIILGFHDVVWQQPGIQALTREERGALLETIFAQLRSGGVMLVIDHRAEDGSGTRDIDAYHRIDEAIVREEFIAAGFEVAAESDILSNPDDTRMISVFDPSIRGNTDRFVLLFRKPL